VILLNYLYPALIVSHQKLEGLILCVGNQVPLDFVLDLHSILPELQRTQGLIYLLRARSDTYHDASARVAAE
jgi:hypothetical protein